MTKGAPARPLSPHLQIWRWTPIMASSILHRATGVALTGGAALLGAWFIALAMGPEAYRPVAALISSEFGRFALFLFAWALIYHTLNGLRHLYWDSGRGLNHATATMTSWFVFAGSALGAIGVFVAAALTAGGAR
jgi:succinate dehydrogenase / fumarate reductase cytochrome b subunit